MNREIRDAWAERLESPEKFRIHQVNGYMGDVTGGRCCLAVLGDILSEKFPVDVRRTLSEPGDRVLYDGEAALPTVKMLRLAGIREQSTSLFDNCSVEVQLTEAEADNWGERRSTLAALNDSAQWPFARIAAKVRAMSDVDENVDEAVRVGPSGGEGGTVCSVCGLIHGE